MKALKLIGVVLITLICILLIILADDLIDQRQASAMRIIEGCRHGSYLHMTISTGIFSDGLTVKCESMVRRRIDPRLMLRPHMMPTPKKEEPTS